MQNMSQCNEYRSLVKASQSFVHDVINFLWLALNCHQLKMTMAAVEILKQRSHKKFVWHVEKQIQSLLFVSESLSKNDSIFCKDWNCRLQIPPSHSCGHIDSHKVGLGTREKQKEGP